MVAASRAVANTRNPFRLNSRARELPIPPGEHLRYISEAVVGICPKSLVTYPVMSTDLRVSVVSDMFGAEYDKLNQICRFER